MPECSTPSKGPWWLLCLEQLLPCAGRALDTPACQLQCNCATCMMPCGSVTSPAACGSRGMGSMYVQSGPVCGYPCRGTAVVHPGEQVVWVPLCDHCVTAQVSSLCGSWQPRCRTCPGECNDALLRRVWRGRHPLEVLVGVGLSTRRMQVSGTCAHTTVRTPLQRCRLTCMSFTRWALANLD
jgi:hypothetical protein